MALQAAMSLAPSFAAAEQGGAAQEAAQLINSAQQTGEWEKWWNWGGAHYDWYFKKSNGEYHKGLLIHNKKLYYLDSYGIMQTGDVTIKGRTYKFNDSGALIPPSEGVEREVVFINDNTYYLNDDGVMQTGVQQIGVYKRKGYFKDDGTGYTGIVEIDGNKHRFDHGFSISGWFQDGGKWYHQDDNGTSRTGISIAKENTGWTQDLKIGRDNGRYLNSDGTIQTGFKTIDGKKYFFKSDGELNLGWAEDGGKKYFITPDKGAHKGLLPLDDKKYFFEDDGALLTKAGVKQIGDKLHYFGSDGVMLMKTGLQTIGGKKYFFNSDSSLHTGSKQIGDKLYLFGIDGAMLTKNGWHELDWPKSGYRKYYIKVDSSLHTGLQNVWGKIYYFQKDGVMLNPTADFYRIDGKIYHFNFGGSAHTGEFTAHNNKKYYFGKDGVMQTAPGDDIQIFDATGW
nr:hypothetical protein [Bacillus cereus]